MFVKTAEDMTTGTVYHLAPGTIYALDCSLV